MKRSVLLTVFTLLVLIVGAVAVDATVTATQNFSSSTPAFGGVEQEASNPNSDKDADKNIIVSSTITLQSSLTSGESITGIQIIPETGFTTADLGIVLKSTTPVTISNTGTPVSFDARISEKVDAVEPIDFKAQAFKVATVNLMNGANIVGSFNAYMQRENKLVVDDLDVVIVGPGGLTRTQSLDTSDVDKLDQVKPGDQLEITAKVENRYKSSANLDIEDIDITMTLEGEDIDDEDDDDIGDLSEDEDDEITLTLEVDEDADKQTATLFVVTNGEDEHGSLHGYKVEADVEVDRETHEIAINNLALSPFQVSCSDENAQLSVNIKNIGRRDETEVAIAVDSTSLGYRDRVSNLELDKDDTRVKVFNIPFAKDLKEGQYAIQVQTFTNNVELSNSEIILLESICTQKEIIQAGADALKLSQNRLDLQAGKSTSLPVVIKNTGSETADFTVSLMNGDDFLEPVSSTTVTLLPNQETTSFFNLRVKEDAEGGTYTATVALQSAGKTLTTQSVVVEVPGEEVEETSGFSFGSSQVLWIILDIFLVIIAIFFIKMIFFGKKGVKMRDIKLQ
ncbi:MAG: hypothetical protein Q8R00_02815 [Candidatus Nanoarchaeia archaeon]|nr:hypothetical protein [Candidatus Nanoarchaeia archaeon]